MKIILCLNHFLPFHVAGTEIYVWALSKQLQSMGCDIVVLIPNYNSEMSACTEYEGIKVFGYAEPSIIDRELITGQRVADGLTHFITYINAEKPDIVHFHEIAGSNGITVAHLEAAKATRAKVIFTIHLANATCRAGTLMLETKKLCDGLILEGRCSYCTLIHRTKSKFKASVLTRTGLVLSSFGMDSVKWQNPIGTALSYPSQIKRLKRDLGRIVAACDKIIPLTEWYHNILRINGVPLEKMHIISQALPSAPKPFTKYYQKKNLPVKLVFVGRIDPLKGIQLLVDVIKKFTSRQLQVDVYGNVIDNTFYDKCKEATASFPNMQWKGKLKKEKVIETIQEYDALILPSMFSEMSPLVIQEAFAAGIPVIGSNVYGIAEQVKDGVNGLLFQFGNVSSLAQTLQKLISNPELLNELSSNIKPVCFFKEVADATMKVYEGVL